MTSPIRGILFADQPRCLGGFVPMRAAAGTTASYNSILDAATPGDSDKPAKTTTIGYRDVLTQLWLLDPLPAWAPTGNALTRLAQACSGTEAPPCGSGACGEAAESDTRHTPART